MRVTADRDRCIGAAQCVLSAPTVFAHDDEGLVVVLTPEPGGDLYDAVHNGRVLCPSGAVQLVED